VAYVFKIKNAVIFFPVYGVALEPAFLTAIIVFWILYIVALGTTFIISVIVF
jgi:hypothetical protein